MDNYALWGIDKSFVEKAKEIEKSLAKVFKRLDDLREYNQLKVLHAMQEARFSEAGFAGTTGYGYDDMGREQLETVYAKVFGTEKALVRPQLCSATQALSLTLSAILRPGDELLAATGAPYDTLRQVIGAGTASAEAATTPGHGHDTGSLRDFGVTFKQVELNADGTIDLQGILAAINPATKVVLFQRSRGYGSRPALSVYALAEAFAAVHALNDKIICMTDNCYGEFTEKAEPTDLGSDLAVGSLIKNPGGGLAATGAYVVGKGDLVELVANRLYAPGLGLHVGPMLGQTRSLAQGFYMAPHVVTECLKGLALAAAVFAEAGFKSSPSAEEERYDIIQTITFNAREPMLQFCRAVQAASPIDSYVTPEPWAMPGYDCEVIMAAGAFVQGASIELSTEGPVKPPFTAFMQGGLVYENVKLAALLAVQKIAEQKRSANS